MADLRMKLNTNNEIKVKMKANDSISMKFDDYQKFKEEDPIFKDSPAYTITYNDINAWNNKSNFSGDYNDLTHKPNLSQYATVDYVTSGLSNKVDKEIGMGLSQNSFTTEEKNKLASLENYDDTAIVEALSEKADISDIPTLTSELDNDSGFITKDVNDLTYYPTNDSVNSIVALKQNIIDSENLLSADLVDDTSTTNKFVTATDITNWNAKSEFSGSYNDLSDKPTIPTKTSDLTNDSGFVNSTYVNNAVKQIFSLTDEVVVGTYLGKPLYRKVFEATPNQTTSTSFSFDIPLANVDQVFILPETKIADSSSSGYVYCFPNIHSNTANLIGGYISVQTTKLVFNVRKGSGISFYAIRLALEYTKTTD